MSNKLIRYLKDEYMSTGLSEFEATREALETYKQIRADIRGGSKSAIVLADYKVPERFLEDVL